MPISVMIKPASSACNLKCEYCFYSSLAESRDEAFKGMMSEQTADEIITKAFDFANGTDVFFTFQGGEPLLRGLEFFEYFFEKEQELNLMNSKVSNCIQTNGTLIDEDWCQFFKQHNVLVGVSLDGNEQHNKMRVYPDGSPSFDDVVAGIDLLKKHDVTFNVLSVLTSNLANNFRGAYRFFKGLDLHYLQFIPCLDDEDNKYSMSVEEYETYLNSAYKIYFNDNMRGNLMSIRQFDNYALLASGKPAEQCGMNGPCSTQFVVEGDGSVYPCDFYCTDEWLLGNINDSSFEKLYNCKNSVEFLKESFIIDEKCKNCEFFQLCRAGGCKRNRQNADYCSAYKSFFSKSIDMIMQMR